MNQVAVTLASVMVWASFAISSATPANAKMQTSQTGDYALCSNAYNSDAVTNCNGSFAYKQNLKLVASPCSQGSCEPAEWWPNVELRYGTGRKQAYDEPSCNSWNLYGLTSCSC